MSEGPWKLPKGWRWVRLGEVAVRDTVTINPSSGDANGWPKFQRLEPRILVPKSETPMVFIDTFFWKLSLDTNHALAEKLHKACLTGMVKVVLSDMVIGEGTRYNLLDKVKKICRSGFYITNSMHITANQIIQALLVFMHNHKVVQLPWDLVITESPVIGKGLQGLRGIVDVIEKELNKLQSAPEAKSRESLVSELIYINQETWRDILKIYGNILCEETGSPPERYEEFFWTDFFTDLPAIVLSAYLLAYALHEKVLRANDIIDTLTTAELLPYVDLYIADRKLSARFDRVVRDYPEVFSHYKRRCRVISGLDASTQVLEKFLERL